MGRGDSAASAAEQQSSSTTAPLLEKTSAAAEASEAGGGYYYVDGCPGCAVDRHKAANPGIPYANFLYVWIVTLCTGTLARQSSPCHLMFVHLDLRLPCVCTCLP